MESDSTSSIVDYLTLVSDFRNAPAREGWVVGCYEDLLLRYGHPFTHMVPDDLERGEMSYCYENAARYVKEHEGYHYCEGYALSLHLPIPIPHAWVVDDDGHAIDVTWDYPEGEAFYFGVPLLCDALWTRLYATGRFGILVNDWEVNDLDLLRNGIPEDHIPEAYQREEQHGEERSQAE